MKEIFPDDDEANQYLDRNAAKALRIAGDGLVKIQVPDANLDEIQPGFLTLLSWSIAGLIAKYRDGRS